MDFSVPPMSANSWPISFLPVARPHLGNMTWASSANRSRMLPPVEVVPALSKALRYSRATDLRCSSVIVWVATATGAPCREKGWRNRSGRGWSERAALANRFPVGGLRGSVGEGDDRAEGGAAGPVGLGGRGGDAVAHAVEARDRRSRVVEDLRLGVRARATLRIEGAPGDETRVVRAAAADRPHSRVRAARLVLDRPVEQQLNRLLAAVEVLVHPVLGEPVEPLDRLPQGGDEVRVQGEPAGQVRVPGEPVGDGVGERLEGLAADDVRVIGAGRHDLAAVLVAGRVVLAALVPDLHEDEVGVLAVLAVVGEELLRQLVVLQLLVNHPAAGPVDEDR